MNKLKTGLKIGAGIGAFLGLAYLTLQSSDNDTDTDLLPDGSSADKDVPADAYV